jgi:hypothetical protein
VKKAGSKKKKKGPKIPPSESEVTDGAGATPTKTEKGAGAGGQSHSHSHSTAAPHPTADVQPKRQSKKSKRKAAADAPSDPRPAKVTKASVPDKRDPDVAVSSDSSHARTATHGGIADRAAAPQRNTPARKPSKAAKRLQGARFRMLNEKVGELLAASVCVWVVRHSPPHLTSHPHLYPPASAVHNRWELCVGTLFSKPRSLRRVPPRVPNASGEVACESCGPSN